MAFSPLCDSELVVGLVGCLDDLHELLGNQGSAADEAAVDVGLSQQLKGVLVVPSSLVMARDVI